MNQKVLFLSWRTERRETVYYLAGLYQWDASHKFSTPRVDSEMPEIVIEQAK
jgi:hypothetical protein